MDSPEVRDPPTHRPSIIETFSCAIAGLRIDKDDLRRRISMPQYLRLAVRRAVNSKDVSAGVESTELVLGNDGAEAVDCPMVVFVNSRSGGRHGPELKERLQQLMGEEQVFDLSNVKPQEFVEYGLGCLEQLARNGDECAQDTRDKLRIVEEMVQWVGSLGVWENFTSRNDSPNHSGMAHRKGLVGSTHRSPVRTPEWPLFIYQFKERQPVPPVAIIPLGTGNDLSRSFGWGGSFPFGWKAAVKKSLLTASSAPICRLDSWQVSVTMPAGVVELPHSLNLSEQCTLDEDLEMDSPVPQKVTCYDGVFYNYFSIGMDAQVAYGFHNLRNEKPYLAQGPIANKLIYSGYSCTQGWFFTPCISDPGLRGLRNILKIYIKKDEESGWEVVPVPSNLRSIVCLNLHNYASGRHPWGNLSTEYLEKRGFVEAHADDGILEIFGLKDGWHASFVMVELISAKHIAQAAAIRMEIRGAEFVDQSFLQLDGEPWRQPLDDCYSTFVEITRIPFQSLMISGDIPQ